MFGAILGNIIGSPYEFDSHNIRTKDFDLFSAESEYTDDGIMTVAVADALLKAGPGASDAAIRECLTESLQSFGRDYPMAGYGMDMSLWLHAEDPAPISRDSNEAAARAASVAWLHQEDLARTRHVARLTASTVNKDPETVKGADALASVVFLALHGQGKAAIRDYITKNFGYDLTGTVDKIRETYRFDDSASGSVPQAIICFLESRNYEDAVRTAVSIGGDSDTIACMTGAMAEAAYGIPDELREVTRAIMPTDLRIVMDRFSERIRADREAREKDPARMQAWKDVFAEKAAAPVPEKLRPAGNEPLEEAIRNWNRAGQDQKQEAFNRVCVVMKERLKAGARVIAPGKAAAAADSPSGRNTFQLQLIKTQDGKYLQPLYTSEGQLRASGQKSVMVVSFTLKELLGRVMQLAGQDNEFGNNLQGLLVNPGADTVFIPLKIVEAMLRISSAEEKGAQRSRILFARGDIRALKCGCVVLEDGHGRPGQIRATDASQLAADRLYMTMIPAYERKRPHVARAAIAETIRGALTRARQEGAVSIAFPPLGTGLRAGAVPLKDAVRTALSAAAQWIRENADYKMDVIFCTDSDGIYEEYRRCMESGLKT